MFKNVASTFIVFAFDATTNVPKTGDAANLTAYVKIDAGSVTVLGDTSATELDATNAPGYYVFDAEQAETNGDRLLVSGKSSTANIKVIGAPAVIYTRPTTGWLAPATAGRTVVVDAAGLVDANMVKAGPTGSGTAQTAKDIGGAVPAAAAGASGGLLISGSNSGTTTLAALTVTGALTVSGGTTLTNGGGVGLTISNTSGTNGLLISGNGSGAAVRFNGGTTGPALQLVGGSSSGNGITITTTSGHGISIAATGTDKHGIVTTGGNGGTSDGFKAVAGTGGVDIRGNITGDIAGTLATLTTYTGNTPQTGDNFALANGAAGFVATKAVADAVKAKTDSLTFGVAGLVDANIQRVNDVVVNGDGSVATPWGP